MTLHRKPATCGRLFAFMTIRMRYLRCILNVSIMTHFRFLLFVALLITGGNALLHAQENERKPQKQSAINLLQGQIEWYNALNGLNPLLAKNRMIVLHVFNPESPSAIESMQTANEIRKRFSYTVAVSVINAKKGNFPPQDEVKELIKRFQVNHPLVFASDITPLNYDPSKGEEVFFIYDHLGELIELFQGRNAAADIIHYFEDITFAEVRGLGLVNADYMPLLSPGVIQSVFQSPTDMVCSERNNLCYVADAHSNRIIALNREGSIQYVIGIPRGGHRDGNYAAAAFRYPEALALDDAKGILYVSDTQNHRIRAVDLASGEVTTILGNGKRAIGLPGAVLDTTGAIHYPGALLFDQGALFIAMRGDNRIWRMDVSNRRATVFAGSGMGVSLDGIGADAAFNSPSGLASAGDDRLYVLDSGSGKLRLIDEVRAVSTLEFPEELHLGQGGQGRLFSHRGELYIANTVNHRIVKRDKKGNFSVLTGTQGRGYENGSRKKARFNAPVAIAPDSKHLLVLDQKNQAIRPVRAHNGRTSNTESRSVEVLFMDADAYQDAHQEVLDDVYLSQGTNRLFIEMKLPPYLEWYDGGRNEVDMIPSRFNRLVTTTPRNGFIEVECNGDEDNVNLNLAIYLTVRDRRNDRIYFRTAVLMIELGVDSDASSTHDITWEVFTEVD